jgi:DNA invertase Pin-like site-specific DNA recombinase
MKRTAALYARVSSDRQKEEGTIASQTTLLLEYAKAHELSVPKEWIFADEGSSGAVLARPALERLRDLAAEGQLQVILIYSPDRLSTQVRLSGFADGRVFSARSGNPLFEIGRRGNPRGTPAAAISGNVR